MTTYHGQVKTPLDAILLFEACRVGILPRVQHRLSDRDRAKIAHGCVYVWDEHEAAIRRWTDGKSWSASRVFGAFLTYRETYGDSNCNNNSKQSASNGTSGSSSPVAVVKPDGLVRYSLLVETTTGQRLHLVSYVSSRTTTEELIQPSYDPFFKNLKIPFGLYPDTLVPTMHRQPPQHQYLQHQQPVFNSANGCYPNPVQYAPRQFYSPPTVSVYPPFVFYPAQHPQVQQASIVHHAYSVPPHNNQHYSHYQHTPIPYCQTTVVTPTVVTDDKERLVDFNTKLYQSQNSTSLHIPCQKRSPIQKNCAKSHFKSITQRRSPTTAANPVVVNARETNLVKPMSKSTSAIELSDLKPLINSENFKLPVLSLPSETSWTTKSGVDARAIKVLDRKFTL